MRFSVVIPTYNRRGTLRQALEAVAGQDYPDYEVIVVDDGSSDGTPRMVSETFPRARCLAQDNRGPAAARNRGVGAASGEVVAFTDDDCQPPPDWLSRLAGGYARFPGVAGVGGSIRAPEAVLRANLYAQYEQYISRVIHQSGEEESAGGYECPAGGTNNMSYRKSVLEAVGGFDEGFPVAAGEDADLKLRIVQAGHQLAYVPVWVTHLQSYDGARFRRQCLTRGLGRNYFERKHGAGWPSRRVVALRAAKRLLSFGPDLLRMRPRRLAWARLQDGLFTCLGQWARPPAA